MGVSAGRLTVYCLVVGLLLASCQRPGPLPSLQLEGLPPSVRKMITEADEAARSRPNDGQASGRLGMLLLAHRLPQPALVCFDRARLLDPGSPQWTYYAGVIQQESKRFDAARQAFEAFLKVDPSAFAAQVRLAESLLVSGQRAASQERFAAALEQRPKEARACYGMGLLLQSQGKMPQARLFFERALEAFPRYRRARLALAETWRAVGDTATATALVEGYNLAHAETQVVPLEDPLMAEIARLDAGPRATRLHAQALARSGQLPEAIALLESALREDPRQIGYRSDLMMYFTREQEWERAESLFHAMVSENPDNAVAHSQRGELLVAQGRCEEAVESFDSALQLDPALADAHLGLGQCQTALGRSASAEGHYRKAVESQPDLAAAQASLGIQLAANGKFSEAIPHLLRANSTQGQDKVRVLFALGDSYQKTGQQGDAQTTLETARILADVYGSRVTKPAPPARRRPAARGRRATVR